MINKAALSKVSIVFSSPDFIPGPAKFNNGTCYCIVLILSLQTNRLWQTVQTKIRLLLLLEEQSDQGLHCLPFHLHVLDKFLYGNTSLFDFRVLTENMWVS